MSAPNTDVEKQEKRHAGPLVGIVAAVIFVAVLLLGYTFFIATPAEISEPDTVPSPDINQVLPEEVEEEAIAPQAPITVAPPSDAAGPPTTRGDGQDGDIIDALPNQ